MESDEISIMTKVLQKFSYEGYCTAGRFKGPDRTHCRPRDDSATAAVTLNTNPYKNHVAPELPGRNCCTSAETDTFAADRERSPTGKIAPALWPIPKAKIRDPSIFYDDSSFNSML